MLHERVGSLMTTQRTLRLGTFLAGTGSNMASWRHPHAVADAAINLNYYKELTRRAEAAKLDFVFFGDGLYISEKSHPNFLNRFHNQIISQSEYSRNQNGSYNPLERPIYNELFLESC